MEKKIAILTGATGGYGTAIASYLCKTNNYHTVLCCRSENKADTLINTMKENGCSNQDYEIAFLDLSDSKSIEDFLNYIRAKFNKIDLLINNAGALFETYQTDENGYEITMSINCLSPMKLCVGLEDKFSQNSSIINVISLSRNLIGLREGFLKGSERPYIKLAHYARSKRALALFSSIYSEQLKERNVFVNCIDPWIVNTDILTMNTWYDRLCDIVFRPLVKTPQRAVKAVRKAVENQNKLSSYVFMNAREYKIEGLICNSKQKQTIENLIENYRQNVI